MTDREIARFIRTCGKQVVGANVEVFGMFGICARFDRQTKVCIYSNLVADHPAIEAMRTLAFG